MTFDFLVRFFLCGATMAALTSCGGGAVSAPATPVTPAPISITPSTATLFSELPTNFIIVGGSGSYVITSSNQAVVPIAGPFSGTTFTVVPNPVATETNVTLTIRDTATALPVTADLTVRPRTVENIVTITPSASQSAACGTSICSGGDAEVRVSLSQGGLPIVGRHVRFDVISGDVRIITSPAGLPETLSTSGTTSTDSTGTASMRVRVLADATSQTALLQITDVSSGFTQRTSISIAPSSNAPLNAQPSTIVFQGIAANTCASGVRADVIVFGGRPPYLISQPGSFQVSPTTVTQSGGRFTIEATGQCTAGSQIAVVDSNGATVSVSASNTLSDVPAPTAPTPTAFSVSPTFVSLGSCNDVANVLLIGGSGTYVAASGNAAVIATTNGTTGSVRRRDGAAPGTGFVIVTFSDGKDTREVSVDLNGEASGACPPPPPAPSTLTVSPDTVTLASCSDVANVTVSGGTGSYQVSDRSTAITTSGFTNFFSIRRSSGSPATSSPVFVDVYDGQTLRSVTVNLTGAGAGAC